MKKNIKKVIFILLFIIICLIATISKATTTTTTTKMTLTDNEKNIIDGKRIMLSQSIDLDGLKTNIFCRKKGTIFGTSPYYTLDESYSQTDENGNVIDGKMTYPGNAKNGHAIAYILSASRNRL